MKTTRPTGYSTDLRIGLKSLYSWWTGELAEMVPSALRRSAFPTENLLLARIQDDALSLFWRDSKRWRELGRLPLESSPAQVAGLLSAAADRRVVVLRLPATAILRRQVELPLAAEQELQQILGYQLDSLSPYPPDQIYFCHRILERDFTRRTLNVELCMAPREEVDPLLRRMQDWNLPPDFVDFVDRQELAPPVMNLLPGSLAGGRPRRSLSRLNMALLLLNLLLVGALIATHLVGKADLERELTTRVETAKLQADAANRLRTEVARLREESSFLQNLKQERYLALEVIDEMSRILPDGTWLEKAVYKKGEIVISGVSSKASTLISMIERSPLFQEVAFQSSVVQDHRSGGERFQIRAEIAAPGNDVN